MKNITFKYIAAWNFLPFGPEGIQLQLDKYKNIILIRGENRDAKAIDSPNSVDNEDSKISSNGSGKSSLQDLIVYGLFGKTVKRPDKLKVNDVVHNKVGRDCKVEIIFDKYRLVRTRMDGGDDKKNTLRFWESEQGVWDKSTEITQGTMATTQKEIERKIGLSYDAFVSMCIFTDDQRACFLECSNTQKKEIVENMLSLSDYREWHDNATNLKREIVNTVKSKTNEYKLLLSNKEDSERRLILTEKKHQDWQLSKKGEISVLEKRIQDKEKELTSTDGGSALLAYQEAQSKIKAINEKLPLLEAKKDALNKNLKIVKDKESDQKIEGLGLTKQYSEYSSQAKSKAEERKKKLSEISDLESNTPGTRCGKCRGLVKEEDIVDYIAELKREISNINLDIKALMLSAEEVGKKAEDLKLRQNKVNGYITQFNSDIVKIESEMKALRFELTTASQVREPKADSAEFLLEQQREELKTQLESKKQELLGRSPFQDIIDNDKIELDKVTANVKNKETEVKALEAEVPYFDYWISGFGDKGIRKWIVDGIIPELNNRINYWLQFLIDNKITLKFDNELTEKIERNPVDGDPYVYHAMSTGQRRRLNLAVSQSFAHVMTTSSGAIPSVIFLDEVSTNVDPLGVQGIYNMITELSEDKQVFVTTHDPDLIAKLQGVDVIKLVHENGFTKLVS
jgi:DNA repair exonuclease SbcCD ATPase subunit